MITKPQVVVNIVCFFCTTRIVNHELRGPINASKKSMLSDRRVFIRLSVLNSLHRARRRDRNHELDGSSNGEGALHL